MKSSLPSAFQGFLADFNEQEISLIERAANLARESHKGQKRMSGEDYFKHPERVALELLKDGYDSSLVAAGFLHDVLEDTEVKEETLVAEFGESVYKLVEGVTKVSNIKLKNKSKIFDDYERYLDQVDNYRKIFFAIIKNPKIIVVKLYDRLDNIRTVRWLKPEKQKFYARETIQIFAPMAERLGMGRIKTLLEDTAFPYAYPEEYRQFRSTISEVYAKPEQSIKNLMPKVKKSIESSGIKIISISGRAKGLYSLYKKLERKGSIKTIYDIVAMRIIVEEISQCYQVLGIVHSLYEPVPNQIDDYVAKPKANGYQSIHTTVKSEDGEVFEIQIRTKSMHELAEFGPMTSHWSYKETRNNLSPKQKNNDWANELEKLKTIEDNGQFLSELKDQLFADQIFVFTPKGDIVRLPKGATVIDFAYYIHSELGDHLSGARINSHIASISSVIQTGDTIELFSNKNTNPKQDWLRIAKTSAAKQHIRAFIRKSKEGSLISLGKAKLNAALKKFGENFAQPAETTKSLDRSSLPYKTIKHALIAVGENALKAIKLAQALYPNLKASEQKKKKLTIIATDSIKSLTGIRHEYANCCKPKPKDQVIGYISNEHVVKVHKINCKRLVGVEPKRLVELK